MTILSSLLLFASPKSLKLRAEKILTIVGGLQLQFDAFGFNFCSLQSIASSRYEPCIIHGRIDR